MGIYAEREFGNQDGESYYKLSTVFAIEELEGRETVRIFIL